MNSGYDLSVSVNSWNKILIEVRLTKFENLKKIKKYIIIRYICTPVERPPLPFKVSLFVLVKLMCGVTVQFSKDIFLNKVQQKKKHILFELFYGTLRNLIQLIKWFYGLLKAYLSFVVSLAKEVPVCLSSSNKLWLVLMLQMFLT